ncbi:MAG TPA: RNA-binding protein [Thermohalobaculum sp.]|nr:RNA-binding protein [Thermohalobaculum sp.]
MTRGGMTKTRAEPERRCIATGDSGPTDLLVRFVLGPDAQVVPDLAERLPGRGVWLTAQRALVDKAVKKKLFSRAFKAQAVAPADLADRLEALLAQRLVNVIGLARKAGQAVTGFEKVRARLKDGTAGVLIQASDGAEDGKAKLTRLADGLSEGGAKRVPGIEILDSTELGLAFGRDFAIHAALDRGGFADRAIGEAARLCGLRPTDVPTDETTNAPRGETRQVSA